MYGAAKYVGSVVSSLLGKRGGDRSEGSVDGRPSRRRKISPTTNVAINDVRDSRSLSPSKQSSMTSNGPVYFDSKSDRFFPKPHDKGRRSANPVADVAYAEVDLEEVEPSTARHSHVPAPAPLRRTTRSSQLAINGIITSEPLQELGHVQGGLTRITANNAQRMASRKPAFLKNGGYKPKNTLDQPANHASSRSQFIATNTRRSAYEVPDSLHQPVGNTKRTSTALSQPSTSQNNPPYKNPCKKPRTGESPMQGQSRHDAISLDDSQELDTMQEDEIQFTPERKQRSSHEADEDTPADTTRSGEGSATGNPTQRLVHHGIPERVTDNEEFELLPDRPALKRNFPTRAASHAVVLVDYGSDSEAEDFTKMATRERKQAEKRSDPCPFNLQSDLDPSADIPTKGTPANTKRNEPSPVKQLSRTNGSQSPDVLQEGTTTRDLRPSGTGRYNPDRGKMSNRPASVIAASIVGNDRSTEITRTPKAKQRTTSSDIVRFELTDVKCSFLNFPEELLEKVCFYIDLTKKVFYFDLKDPMINNPQPDTRFEVLSTPYPTRTILKALYGTHSSKLVLHLSLVEGRPNAPIALELESHKRVFDLVSMLQTLDDNFTHRVNEAKIDSYFENAGKMVAEFRSRGLLNINVQRDNRLEASNNEHRARSKGAKLDTRMVDKLDNPAHSRTIIMGRDRQLSSRRNSDEVAERSPPTRSPAQMNGNDTNLTSPYFGEPTTRNLRSATTTETRRARTPSPFRPKYSQTGALGEPWKNSLRYPKEGKKPEQVDFGDLPRLDEEEFLNDSLIGFFLRYLQHRTEIERPEDLKKMHFFNSYFFDSLNKGTKSAKTINYDSVSRWTRLIDIFNRDFVIVPVNENLHWFVAIICNLSHFKRLKEKGNVEDDEEMQSLIIDDEGQEGEIENEEQLQAVIIDDEDEGDHSRRTKETQESFEELRIDDNRPRASLTVVSSSQAKDDPTPKGKRGRKQKPRRSLPKYDTDLPVIITFDSLGAARGNVSAALKQYVVREALGKKEWEISDQEIRGMTAKNIPTQGNYSDCGLYMCMYLEQFMCDPYGFVEKILQREENQIRWPHRIRSEDLRARMRDLIMELHRQQEGEEAKGEIPPLGKILVDMREPSPELELEVVGEDQAPELPMRPHPAERLKPEKIKAQKKLFTEHFNETAAGEREDDDGFEPEADDTPLSASQQKRFAEAARAQVDAPDDPIVIDDEGSPVKKRRKSQSQLASPSHKAHSSPWQLAKDLRERRDRLEQKLTKRSSPVKEQRHLRSDSITTDFLSGVQSYSDGRENSSPERAARRGQGKELKKSRKSTRRERKPLAEIEIELPDEVPETQEQDEESQEESESEIESEVEGQELQGNLNGAGEGRKNRAERVPSEELIEI